MTLYQNKITLFEIKKLISSLEHQKDFLNKLFEPLKKPAKPTFLDSYLCKNKKHFMNGNYDIQTNENCRNHGKIIRKNIRMLESFAEQLQDNVIFNKMLDSVKNIVDVGILNTKHEVFGLIQKDINAMPDSFVKCINNCIDTEKFYEALLFLILWSIYGECIEKISPVYEEFTENMSTEKYDTKKNNTVRLLTNTKPCRPVFKGRNELLLQMYKHFQSKNHFLFLQGTGGIGKSELAKRYAEKYQSSYDVIVFAECDDSLISAVNDDNTFPLTENFISKRSDETEQQFYERKLSQLKKMTDRTLIILDNMDYFSEELDNFLSVPFDVIITTRYNYFSEYSANTKIVTAIENRQTLIEIFSTYCDRNVDEPFTDMLIDMFEGHTMAIELVAKQMKVSNLTSEAMYKILKNNEEAELNETFRVLNYDSKQRNIASHMQRLFNIALLSEDEQYIMMCLSLLPLSGMDKEKFKKCCNLSNFSDINRLIERSWVRESDGCISVHALIRETIKITLKPDLIKCIDFINGLMYEFPSIKFYHTSYSEKSSLWEIAHHIYKCFPEPTEKLYDFYEWLELIFNHYRINHISLEIANKLLSIYKQNFGENHFRTARIFCRTCCSEKEYYSIDEATKNLEKGREIIINLKNKSDKEVLYVSDIDLFLSNKYTEYYDLSNNEFLTARVEELCNEMIKIRTSFKGTSIQPIYLCLIVPYRNLAFVAVCRHEYDKAYFYINKAIEECDKLGLEYEYSTIDYLKSRMMKEQGNILFAIDYMRSAIQKHIEYFEKYEMRNIYMTYELGDLYRQIDDTENAVIHYRKAIEYINDSHLCLGLRGEIADKIKSIVDKKELQE